MARFTPAGNPAGRFPAESHAALDEVFAAAAPLASGEVDIPNSSEKMSRAEALIRALGELDKHVQLNSIIAGDLPASELCLKYHAIVAAAKKLLQKLEISGGAGSLGMPEQVRKGLENFAEQEAMGMGGFENHPPQIHRNPFDEEDYFTDFHPERQLQQNIEGIAQLLGLARQAEELAERVSKCVDKDSKEAARAREEFALSNLGKGMKFDICEGIFEIWIRILERPLRTSVRKKVASGPLVRFTTSCLALLGYEPLTPSAIRARARRLWSN